MGWEQQVILMHEKVMWRCGEKLTTRQFRGHVRTQQCGWREVLGDSCMYGEFQR